MSSGNGIAAAQNEGHEFDAVRTDQEEDSKQLASTGMTSGQNFELYRSAESEQYVLIGECDTDCCAKTSDDVLAGCMTDLSLKIDPEERKIFTFTRGQGFDLVRSSFLCTQYLCD